MNNYLHNPKIVLTIFVSLYNIKMAQKYKIRNTLKNLPFYSEEIKNFKKKNKKFSNIRLLSELPFFLKNLKN